jgi:3',5'-nucleoside bisphosphate phosphatase
VARAFNAGVRVLAVTDHDTVNGLADATAAARALGMELVPGIEISTAIGPTDIHILGHFIRPEALLDFTRQQEGERRARMGRMVEKLNALGIDVAMTDVERIAGSDNLCRPHLARALIQRGVCGDMQSAFEKYIGDHAPAFSAHRHPDARETIALIRSAGGVATLAHPAADKVTREQIAELKEQGLAGLEVMRVDLPSGARDLYMQYAFELDLVPTAGSDFHGPEPVLGKIALEPKYFDRLRSFTT